MKRLLSIVLSICMLCVVCALPVMADDVITIKVDGKMVDCTPYGQAPVIVEGRTLVPLRAVFEALGATVEWDNPTRTVIAEKGDIKISLTVDSDQLYVNDAAKTIDVPARIMNDRTVVPVRAIAEAFGCKVEWDNNARCVVITSLQADISAPLTSTQMVETAEGIVTQMWSKVKAEDIEGAAEYFADSENISAAFSMDAIVEQMTGSIDMTQFTPEQVERVKKASEEFVRTMLAGIDIRIESGTLINSDTVLVQAVMLMPDYQSIDVEMLANSDEAQELLAQILEKYGYTVDTAAEMTIEELYQVNNEYTALFMEYTYNYIASQTDSLAITEQGPVDVYVTLTDGKWLITE